MPDDCRLVAEINSCYNGFSVTIMKPSEIRQNRLLIHHLPAAPINLSVQTRRKLQEPGAVSVIGVTDGREQSGASWRSKRA